MSVFFKGTSLEQDSRFPDKQKKLLAKMNFPEEYDQKVNLSAVRLDLLRPWIARKVRAILGLEDDVVVDLVCNSLEAGQKAAQSGSARDKPLDPRELQITMTGFLERAARPFMAELWTLLVSASAASNGIPPQLLEEKKNEIVEAQRKAIETAQAQAALRAGLPIPQPAANDGRKVSRFGPRPSEVAAALGVSLVTPIAAADGSVARAAHTQEYLDRERRQIQEERRRNERRSPRRSRSPRRHSRSPRRSRSRSPRHRHSSRHHSSSRRHRSRSRSGSPRGGRSHSRSRSRSRSPPRRRHHHHRRSSRDEADARKSSRSRSPRETSAERAERRKARKEKRSKRSKSRSHSKSPSKDRSRSRSAAKDEKPKEDAAAVKTEIAHDAATPPADD